MKKVLSVSIVAMLAVVPLTAKAAQTATPVALVNGGNTVSPLQTVASTTYVQGAYNTLGRQVNNIISDSTVPSGTYTAIANTKNVSENLVALDTAINGLKGGGEGSVADQIAAGAQNATYNPSGEYGENTIGGAIQGNTAAISANTSAISTLTGAADVPGSVANSVAAETSRATAAESDLSDRIGTLGADGTYIRKANSVSSNLSALDTAVNLNTLHIGTMNNLSTEHNLTSIESRSTLVSAINTLDTAISNLNGGGTGSVAEQIQAGAQNATYNAAGSYAAGTVGDAIQTNTGNINTMRAQTIDVVTTWGNDANPTRVNLFD